MTINHKIQAYTISEMVVVIILTSITVGIAFSVLSLVRSHMNVIQTNLSKDMKLSLLEQSLFIDFNSYSNISYNGLEDQLILKSEIDSIAYKFGDRLIIKDLDTFKIEIADKLFFLDGNHVNGGQVDALKLKVSKDHHRQLLFVCKDNDASLYMN
ncbi:hypothetical protein [uncultured Algibacter sp.]|uniref:hypothetical protein n=1 Tax=uncultured Algibacter sp. TaxID=298659 RepID=UPI002617D483|nr:hypothetical protein [uncultured Algibacter sp.]